MAFSISALLGLSQFIWSTSSAGVMSGGFWGGGRFSSSSKCSLHLFNWSSSLVSTLPFLSLIGLSVRLYFPANFLVIPYSCFMFPWADASSASLARSSMKFALSVFTLFLTALFASVYSSCAVAFAALVRLLLIALFFSFLTCTLLRVSAEIQSFCWYFFFPRTSLHVLIHISLICCHCVSRSMFPSSRRSCSASYLFLTVSRKVSVVSLSFRKSTLYCVLVLLLTSLFFSFIFILASTRWWSEAASAPLCTLTSCIDLLNFRPMQIWSI
ncbi:hypothetical protein NP493_394g01015 [Ridgeia piscesae]|uniref:Uncharacterized protein n=1 Tax=Ridgeia piscesae TaxID=27915 RepID=A0AAD9L2S5_RIDPI|nr:hypothetical protein NP493_394g01015 [Ridgeia piscesae]